MSVAAPLTLDASVLAKVVMREPGSKSAIGLLKAGRALVGPELVIVEVASAVLRRHRTGALPRAGAERALAKARRVFLHSGFVLTPDALLQPRAEQIALDLKHALKDCLYIAAAERAGADFVTADATLLARAAPHFSFVKPL